MANQPKNEFEELQEEEAAPETEFSEALPEQDLIAGGSTGTEYDWSKAPDGVKAPPRIDLNGKIITIKKAKIFLPPPERPWMKTRAGDKECKMCTFTIFYDLNGQQENYSGVRVFKRVINGADKYSHPSITRDRGNQASILLGLFADFKKLDINECSLHSLMAFLNSMPKARIEAVEVTNPTTHEKFKKNMIKEFIP